MNKVLYVFIFIECQSVHRVKRLIDFVNMETYVNHVMTNREA